MIVCGDPDGPEAARCVTFRGRRDSRGVVAVEGATEELQHRGPLVWRESQLVDGADQTLIGVLIYPDSGRRARWNGWEPLGRDARGQSGHRAQACAVLNRVMSRPHTRTLIEHEPCLQRGSAAHHVNLLRGRFLQRRHARSATHESRQPRWALWWPRAATGLHRAPSKPHRR